MLDLTVTECPRLLEPDSLFGYRVVGWIRSSAKHERRQKIARFITRFGSAPRGIGRGVGACHSIWVGCVRPCRGAGDVAGRSDRRVAGISPRRPVRLPRAAYGRDPACRLEFRAGRWEWPRA